MKKGDMVRFAKWEEVDYRDSGNWHNQPKPHIGMLIEHDKLMGQVHILYNGKLVKVRSIFAEKAGRKDVKCR